METASTMRMARQRIAVTEMESSASSETVFSLTGQGMVIDIDKRISILRSINFEAL